MLCPACKKPVIVGHSHCIYCNQDLTLLQSIQLAKQDLLQVKVKSQSLTGSLTDLERRFENLEGLAIKQVTPPDVRAFEAIAPELPSIEQPSMEAPESAATPVSPSKPYIKEPLPHLPAPKIPPPREPNEQSGNQAELWFGQKWLLIAGVTIMVLGIAYFLKYSFDKNWVTPAGRVGMAYLAGVGCLVLGEFSRRKNLGMFGLNLIGGGLAVLYASTFTGYTIYELLSQPLAFALMVMVTALAGTLSLFYDTKWLAVLGLIGGFATPMVIGSGQSSEIALMSYMTILNAGILSIAFVKRWNLLNNLGFLCTWSLFGAWVFDNYRQEAFWPTLFFLNLFFLIYTLVPFGYYFISQSRAKVAEFSITLPNTFIAFSFTFGFITQYFVSRHAAAIASLSYAAMFLAMANILYRRSPDNLAALVMLLGKASILLFLTVPILFSGHWITLFWAGEAVVVLWASTRLANRWLLFGSFVVLSSCLLKFFLLDYESIFGFSDSSLAYRSGYTYLLLERLFTTVSVLASVFLFPWLLKRQASLLGQNKSQIVALLFGIFSLLLFICSNFEVSAFFFDYAIQARLASLSVLWALFSIGLMILGFIKNQQIMRQASIGLFALTAIKVLIQDMADVATPFRILSLIVLGLLLIGASFLYHRFSARILSKTFDGEVAS
jgi:uncharacterized membrane protein